MVELALAVLRLDEKAHFVELVAIEFGDLAMIYYLLCGVSTENHNCPCFGSWRPGLGQGVQPEVSGA